MTLKKKEYIDIIEIYATQLRARTIRPRTRVFHSIHKKKIKKCVYTQN